MDIISELREITARLDQVGSLRKLCLSLARSSAAREIAAKHPANEKVRRTALAIGR